MMPSEVLITTKCFSGSRLIINAESVSLGTGESVSCLRLATILPLLLRIRKLKVWPTFTPKGRSPNTSQSHSSYGTFPICGAEPSNGRLNNHARAPINFIVTKRLSSSKSTTSPSLMDPGRQVPETLFSKTV